MIKVDLRGEQRSFTETRLTSTLPRHVANEAYGGQLKQSACSYSANYLAACKTNSESDFISKLSVIAADWGKTAEVLNLLAEENPDRAEKIRELLQEGSELLLVLTDSVDLL